MISMNKAPKLTPEERKMLNKSFYFSLGTNMASSKVSQQSKCFAMAMYPGLEMFYDDPEDRKKAFYRHAGEFFNTHQVFLGLLVGIALAMEKQQAEHPEEDITETISTLKASLMGPTAGIGDSFFWGTLRILATGVGTSLALQGNILGPILYLLIFNVPHFVLRYLCTFWGYNLGTDFLQKVEKSGAMQLLTYGASIVGLIVAGAMTAEMVYVTLNITVGGGETATALQGILDGIVPGLVPMCLFGIVYWLLKKGVKPLPMTFLLMGVGIVGAFFGFLA